MDWVEKYITQGNVNDIDIITRNDCKLTLGMETY